MSTRPGDSIIESPQADPQERWERLRRVADSIRRSQEGPESLVGPEAARRSTLPTRRQNVEAEILRQQRQQDTQKSGAQIDALMSVIPQASANFSELLAGLSPLTGFREMYEIASRTSPGEIGRIFTLLAQGDIEGSNELFAEIASRSPTAVRQQGLRRTALGGLVQGFGEGLLNLMELPAEVIESLPENVKRETNLDDLSNGIFWVTERSRDDYRRFAEHQDQIAASMGLNDQDILGAKVVGGFAGYTPLLYGGFKAAEIFPFARGAGRAPFMLRDLMAGMILGLSTTEGDLEARIGASASEAAFFGGWSLALAGLGLPLKAFRNRRWMQKMGQKEMEKFIREVNQRYNPNTGQMDLSGLSGAQGKALFQIMSEEQALSQSVRGKRVLARTTSEAGLVPALLDLAQGEATHGIIRGVKNPDEMAQVLADNFPGLEFQVVKRELSADILFGTGKLGDKAIKSFTSTGRFPGQRILVLGQEMEYISKGPTKGRIKARWIDSGKEVPGGVPEELVSDLPFATIARPTKGVQQLVDEFADQFFNRIEHLVKNRDVLSEEEAIQAAREGRLAELGLTFRSRRDAPIEREIGAPEAMGVAQPEVPPEVLAREIAENGFENVHPLRPAEPVTFREVVRAFAERKGILEDEVRGLEFRGRISEGTVMGVRTKEGVEVAERMAGIRDDYRAFIVKEMRPDVDTEWRMTFVRAEDTTPVGRVMSDDFDDLVRVAEELGAQQVDEMTALTADSRRVLTNLEAEAAKAVRQRMWNFVPKEQRRLLQELREQIIRVAEDKGPSLERDAALAGFSVRRKRGTTEVELREVNTGLGATFDDGTQARIALEGVERQFSNDVGRSLYPRMPDETPFTSHLPSADDFFLTGRTPAGRLISRLTENPKWRNLQSWTKEFEELTGIPVHSQIFSRLDEAQQALSSEAEPWLQRVLAIWKDFSREERAALKPFFEEIAGKELSQARMIGVAQKLGLTGKQFRAAKSALELERAMFEVTGLPQFRYLDNHFARILPQTGRGREIPERVADLLPEDLPQEAVAFWQKVRSGELAQQEVDPLLIQLKYVRSVFWDKHLRGPWERARAFLGSRSNPFNIDDLPLGQKARLINTFVNREGVEKAHRVLKEYTGRARGFPAEGERSANRYFRRLLDKLGIDVSEEVVREATNTLMSIMYGAAMGGRPRMTARNLTQNLWYSWMRLDGAFGGEALQQALTRLGWRKAVESNALRPQQRGVFAGGAALEGHLANLPAGGAAGDAAATVTRRLFELGEATRRSVSVSMIPFGSADDFNRAWAYWWQRLHTERYLTRLKRGEINETTFIDEGLRGHTSTTKREFARRMDLIGEDEALSYIGKQHADEVHFIYSRQSQPLWMQGDVGKFGGMFGTFSMWSKDFLWHNLAKNMGPRQAAGMFAKGASFGAALYLVGEEMGIDLNNWISPLSAFTFTGGPVVENVIQARRIMENLTFNPEAIPEGVARLTNEQIRLSYPYQGLAHDLHQVGQMPGGLDMKILSLVLGRPEQAPQIDIWNDILLPHDDPGRTPIDHVLESLDLQANP